MLFAGLDIASTLTFLYVPSSVSTTPFPYSATITSPDGKSVKIYKKPSTNYSEVTRLTVGTKVTVIGQIDKAWNKIELNDGRTGYIEKTYLSIR